MPLPSEAELETQIKNTSGARRRFVRPSPPRGLTWRSDKGLIVWEAPADANAQPGTMYYNLYLDTDSDQGLTLQIPFDQTSVTPPRAAQRVFLSAFNATSQLESPRVLLQQNVGINEANIISGGVGPASVNSPAILVDGLTLTSNSPSAGDVAWSVCTVYWNGTAYTILAGNTSSPFVIWNTGSGSFTGTSSYTPSTNIYLIATNVSGTGDTAWNKVANSHITSSHVLSGSLTGSSLNLGTLAVGPNGSATFDGFTWTANSPSAGDIAYSAGTVSYKGVTYTVSAGSVDNSHQIAVWRLSNPTVLQQMVFPISLGVDDFVIACNRGGQYELAFNLVGIDGARVIIASSTIFMSNQAGELVGYWSMGTAGGVNSQIQLLSSGSNSIGIAANTFGGQITFNHSAQTVAPLVVPSTLLVGSSGRSSALQYLKICNQGGTDYYVPLFT